MRSLPLGAQDVLRSLILLLLLALPLVAQTPSGGIRHQEEEKVGDDAVVRVTANLVTVPVSVVDRDGRYVFDLKKEDFRLYEDGVEQRIAHFSSVERPFSVVLLIDTSFSTASDIGGIKEAAQAFVERLRPEDVISIISFDGTVRPLLLAKGERDRTLLRAAIDNLRTDAANTGTRLYDAVAAADHFLKPITGRKAIILFTDGGDTWSKATEKGTLRDAAESDALVYTIRYGSSQAQKYLQSLAGRTGGRYYEAAGIETMKRVFAEVAEELRRQYSLGYYPASPARAGERRIKVKVGRTHVAVKARRSYTYDPSASGSTTEPRPRSQ